MSESAFDDQLTLADSFEYFCLIFFGRGVSVWSRVGSGAWPLAFVSTGRERHLAAAAKPSPPKFISKVRFDTVFDILRKFCSFCVFFSIFSIQFCAVRFIERYNSNFVAQNIVRFPLCHYDQLGKILNIFVDSS